MFRNSLIKMHPFASATPRLWLVVVCFLGGVLLPETLAKDYWDAGLKKHNEYRASHNVPLLDFDNGLAEMADKCAQYYADKGWIDHTCPYKGSGYDNAENLFMGYAKNTDEVGSVEQATKRWYDEIKDYDFNKNDAKDGKGFLNIGHFTQLTWKNSKRLGIGYAKEGHKCYVVAIYSPPGNYPGKYKENVFPRTGDSGDSDSSNSTASSVLIRGPRTHGATCLTFSLCVMSVGLISGQ